MPKAQVNTQGIKDATVALGDLGALTTKGDLLVCTGSSTHARLAIGTDGHVLTADSGSGPGMKWAAATGGGGGSISVGLAASRPAAGTAGTLYIATDIGLWWLDDGAAWDLVYPTYFAEADGIDLGDYTPTNIHGSSSVVQINESVSFRAFATTSDSLQYERKALPSAPYTMTLGLIHSVVPLNFQTAFLGIREASSGKITALSDMNGSHYSVDRYSNDTTFNANLDRAPATADLGHAGPFTLLRIRDDNTNVYYEISRDGYKFATLYSETRNSYGTQDEVIFGCDNPTSAENPHAVFLGLSGT